jgi:MFS family permease
VACMLQALRIRDFRLLWAGSLISGLGSWLLVIAVPAHVFLATGSLRATGLTLAAEYLPPLVLGPAAGVVADRWDRRRLMIAANLFRGGAVAVMLLGLAPGRYWVLYAALVAESGGGVVYAPAERARTPSIVGTGPVLTGANSLNALANGAVGLIGGPLGGILLTSLGIMSLICADAVSYVASAVINLMTSRSAGRAATTGHVRRDLAEGMRALRCQPAARALLPVSVLFLAANASLTAVLIPFGVDRLGGSVPTGYLMSCLGIGLLLGAPALRVLMDRTEPRMLLAVTLTAWAGSVFVMFTSSALTVALPAAAAIGMSGTMSLVITQTVLQRLIPDTLLGRVSAVFLTAEAAATLVGAVTGPFLAQAAGLTALAAVASLVTLAAAVLAFRRVTLDV